MRTKKMHFKGKTYKYDDEFIQTGNSQLESELKFFDQGENYRVYPQRLCFLAFTDNSIAVDGKFEKVEGAETVIGDELIEV